MLIEYNCTNYAEQRNIIDKLKLLDIDSEYVYIERKRNDPVFVLRRIMATIKNNRKINWDAFNIYRPIRHARGVYCIHSIRYAWYLIVESIVLHLNPPCLVQTTR